LVGGKPSHRPPGENLLTRGPRVSRDLFRGSVAGGTL
jgi:hypothetical protein